MKHSDNEPLIRLSAELVVCRRILREPCFLDLGNISNERLVASFHDLVEDDPIRFSILGFPVSIRPQVSTWSVA